MALDSYDVRSGTPAYKSIPVRVRAAATQKSSEPARELADALPVPQKGIAISEALQQKTTPPGLRRFHDR